MGENNSQGQKEKFKLYSGYKARSADLRTETREEIIDENHVT